MLNKQKSADILLSISFFYFHISVLATKIQYQLGNNVGGSLLSALFDAATLN